MTPSQLKFHVQQTQTEKHFFDRETMKFFGDTMKNFGVRSTFINAHIYNASGDYCGSAEKEVWELYRKRAVKHSLKGSHYFDKVSFEAVQHG